MHGHHNMHRALQPENILLDKDFHPYIAGLGKCQCWDLKTTFPQNDGTTLSVSGDVSEGNVDLTEKIEVYSFRLILYEIVGITSLRMKAGR
jgi:serine/threonine protein kinase